MEAQIVTSRQLCGLDHQVGGDREGAAGCHHHVDHLAVVVTGNYRLGRCQDGINVLDHMIGGKAAAALAQIHRPARQVQPYPDRMGCVDDGIKDLVVATGNQIVVV